MRRLLSFRVMSLKPAQLRVTCQRKCPFRNISLGFSWTASCVSAPPLCLSSARLSSFFTTVCMNVVAHRSEMTGFHTELVRGVIRRRI